MMPTLSHVAHINTSTVTVTVCRWVWSLTRTCDGSSYIGNAHHHVSGNVGDLQGERQDVQLTHDLQD